MQNDFIKYTPEIVDIMNNDKLSGLADLYECDDFEKSGETKSTLTRIAN